MNAVRAFWPAPLGAGVLLWLSFPFAPPGSAFAGIDLGFLAPLGFALLFLSMRLRGGERCGRQALVAAMVWFLAGIWWIAPLVAAGWVFVSFWCAAHEGLFARCLRPAFRAARDRGDARWVVVAPLLHVGFDMVRTVLATGFPWLLPGYSAWRNPVLLGSADLLGVHGATLAVVALGAGLAEVVARRVEGRERAFAPFIPAATLWAAFAAWAAVRPSIEERPGPTVLLLQASLDQHLKEDLRDDGNRIHSAAEFWRAQEDEASRGFSAASGAGRRIDLVIWPETMVPHNAVAPLVPGRIPDCFEPETAGAKWHVGSATMRRVAAAAPGVSSLAGIVTIRPQPGGKYRLRNSALLIDADARLVAHQDKQHLTPGGETLLFLDWLPRAARDPLADWLQSWVGFVPDLEAGEGNALLPLAWPGGTARLGTLVCYESIFPSLSRAMARDGADVLVNISNYGWYTGSPQMEQALAMAAFRAAELRRPMVLASNNGISAVVGPDGRVRASTDADVRTHLIAEVPLAAGGTLFAATGEWTAWLLGAAGACLAFLARRGAAAPDAAQAPETS